MKKLLIIILLIFPVHFLFALDIYLNHIHLELEIEKDREIYLILSASTKDNIDMVVSSLLNIENENIREYIRLDSKRQKHYLKFPYETFNEVFKRKSIELLFNNDKYTDKGWMHIVKYDEFEDIFAISRWFTGDTNNYEGILKYNNISKSDIDKDIRVIIPNNLLLSIFRRRDYKIPFLITIRSFQGREQDRRLLSYGRDNEGEYAIYELQAREALYSAVVVRFTGVTFASDVLEIAEIVAERSGIKRVDDIPIGYKIKIPLEYLLPEFLPESSDERQEYLQYQSEMLRYSRDIKASGLENVHIILDPGHGGIDPGAVLAGVSEHEVVYDIMCRLKLLLETKTLATVHPTLMDTKRGFNPSRTNNMIHDNNEILLTNPNYDLSNSTIGVNLRWLMANHIFENLVKQNIPEENIVFLSIHADHLYAGLSGSMIYIADARYIPDNSSNLSSPSYNRFQEYKYKSRYSFTRRSKLKSQALSQNLANHIFSSLERKNIAIYPNVPLRTYIIRGRRRFVPAVLRNNIIPTKLLIEVGNLNNITDRDNLKDYKFRQEIAEAIYQGLLDYFNK